MTPLSKFLRLSALASLLLVSVTIAARAERPLLLGVFAIASVLLLGLLLREVARD